MSPDLFPGPDVFPGPDLFPGDDLATALLGVEVGVDVEILDEPAGTALPIFAR